jgi:hypothetical protein
MASDGGGTLSAHRLAPTQHSLPSMKQRWIYLPLQVYSEFCSLPEGPPTN